MWSALAIGCSTFAGVLVFSAISSDAAEFPKDFRGSWRFLPFPDSECAIKITDKKVSYSDVTCAVTSANKEKEKDKYKIRLKCRFIDEDKEWATIQEWGLITRDERKRYLVQDTGYDFEVLERCSN